MMGPKFHFSHSLFGFIFLRVAWIKAWNCLISAAMDAVFVDGTFENPELWKECCLKHDIAYWRGGTEEERASADLAFKSCVAKKTGNAELAELMYQAVRTGEALFPYMVSMGVWLAFGRGYKPLNQEEKLLVERKLREYQEKN